MNIDEQFHAYRTLLGTREDTKVYWWYVGTMMAHCEGLPPLPVIQATTLMVYRLETLSRDSFAIHWDEVGYFTDYVSGEVLMDWINPVTGIRVQAPRNFQEGPARYIITREKTGLSLGLDQPGAHIKSLDLQWSQQGSRTQLVQTERKVRGFPEKDGSLPAPGSSAGFEACTRLAFIGEVAPGAAARNCHGIYDFKLAGMPPWLGFAADQGSALVSGIIIKTEPGTTLHARAEQILRNMFPAFFTKHVDS